MTNWRRQFRQTKPDTVGPSPKATATLMLAAKRIRYFDAGEGLESCGGHQSVGWLLRSAWQWQQSYWDSRRQAGLPGQWRPDFRDTPLHAETKGQYVIALTWWSRRYAWDVFQGRDSKESADGLIAAARHGSHEERRHG